MGNELLTGIFVTSRSLAAELANGEKAHAHKKSLSETKSCGGLQVHPATAPQGSRGQAEQSRPVPLLADAFLFRAAIRVFQPNPYRITPEPRSTTAFGLVCACVNFFVHPVHKFVLIVKCCFALVCTVIPAPSGRPSATFLYSLPMPFPLAIDIIVHIVINNNVKIAVKALAA